MHTRNNSLRSGLSVVAPGAVDRDLVHCLPVHVQYRHHEGVRHSLFYYFTVLYSILTRHNTLLRVHHDMCNGTLH